MSTFYVSDYSGDLQAAINAAAAGDTVVIDVAGDYSGSFTISQAITLVGGNAGVAGTDADRNDETNIVGTLNVTAATGTVIIDGVRIDDATDGTTAQNGINVSGAADIRIENSILWAEHANPDDTAIDFGAGATGHITVQSSLISGAEATAWGTGIHVASAAATMTILSNTIAGANTAMNINGADSHDVVERNHFTGPGNGLVLTGSIVAMGHFDHNTYDNTGTEYDFSGSTLPIGYAIGSQINTYTTGSVDVIGSAYNDILGGTTGNDHIDGGAGDDTLTGGAGNDVLKGGLGIDTASYAATVDHSNVSYDATNHTWNVTATGAGTDTLTGVEKVVGTSGHAVLLVDPDGTGFSSIQAAVNAAHSGDTIVLAAGTYTEQVLVNGLSNLTIMAADGANVTIKAPSDVSQILTSSSGRAVNSVVAVENGSNVVLQNVTVDGAGAGNSVDGSNANFIGVYYRNASGGLESVAVTGVHDAYPGGTTADGFPVQSGNQRGVGVQVDNDSQLAFFMHDGSISDFQKNGTVFNNAVLDVTGVHVSGSGIQDISQNGIQILNSTGNVSGNTIDHMGSTAIPDGTWATGVLAYGNTNLHIDNNIIDGANDASTTAHVIGVAIADFGTGNAGGTVDGNAFSYVDEAVDVTGALNPSGFEVLNNTVSHLDLTDSGSDGMYYAADTSGLASNITGTSEGDYLYGGTGADTFHGGAGDDVISGGAGNDSLDGGDGNDSLDGGAGVDTLTGGAGNDTYHNVDTADTVVESAGGGTDTVETGVSYTLSANVENLVLTENTTETFSEFSTGPIINGENGWATSGTHDQGIVDLGGTHGKVFRMSSDPSSGDFGGPYSVALTGTAGETTTTAQYSTQTISFDFAPVSADPQDNSRLEVDLGNASDTDRNNFMVIETTADGVRIAVASPDSTGDFGDSGSFPTDWTTLASGLSASQWHHIDLKVTYHDGAGNDTIDIYADGVKIGTTTTFENYHDSLGGTHDANAEANQTNNLFFRAGNNGQPTDGDGGHNQGFYFDNLSGNNIDGTGNELDNTITGNSGDNTLTGGAGNDTLQGGDGLDTANYTASVITDKEVSYDAVNHAWLVSSSAEGKDSLSHVERVTSTTGHAVLLVDPDGTGFSSIQAAINAAHSGDTIVIAAGTYNESVNVNVAGLTIMGQGEVTIQGTFESDNRVSGSLATWLQTAPGYSATATGTDGVNIAADNTTLTNINIQGFEYGVHFRNDVSNTTLNGVDMAHDLVGIEKATASDVSGLAVNGGSISDGLIGVELNKVTGPSGIGDGIASGINISNTSFSDLDEKGIYAETLTDSTIDGVTMDNVGQYGGVPSNGANGRSGDGIDLNLKAGTYQNVVIENFHLTDTGASSGLGSPQTNGGAIVIEARNDPSYASAPGQYTGTVSIHDGTIDGTTSTGIQVGEPGKANSQPNVTVTNVNISGAQHSGTFGDISNETHSTLTVNGTSGADTIVTASTSDGGAIVFKGGAGDDSFTGHGEADTSTYDATLAASAITNDGTAWHVATGGAEGTDTLTGVETVSDGAGHHYLLVGGNGGFSTIQAAVNAAHDGDTILIATGTYDEQVTVTGLNNLTIEAATGANVTIGAPADLVQTATSSSGKQVNAVVTVNGGSNVTIENITVNGNGAGNTIDGANASFVGVYYRNASGDLENVNITGVHDPYPGGTTPDGMAEQSGAQHGSGVQVDNDTNLAFTMNGGTVDDFQKNGLVFSHANLEVSGVHVSGGGIQAISQNGIEAFYSTGSIDSNTVDHMGSDALADGTYATGIFDLGSSNLNITNNTVTGDNGNGHDGQAHLIAIDAESYNGSNLSDGHITGNAISYADDGIDVSGSMGPVAVDVSGNTFSHMDTADQYQGGVEYYADTGSLAVNLTGSDQHDDLEGSAGNDTFHGGAGDDTIVGNGGTDTAVVGAVLTGSSFSIVGGNWTVTGEGTDTLSTVEKVTDSNGHNFLLVGDGGYASLQAAIDAASAGDTIMVANGTLTGNADVNKALTIEGVNNHGVAASSSRTGESIINGQITVSAASGNVVIDGLYVLNSSDNNTHQDGVAITGAANVTVENTVIHSAGTNANFGVGEWGDVGVYLGVGVTGHVTIDHDLIDGGGTNSFSGASWARAVETETDASVLTITNNSIVGDRSGLGFAGLSANDTVTGNLLQNNGTGIAAGAGLNFAGFTGNTFDGNYDDVNIRTAYSPGVTLDLGTQTFTSNQPDGYVKVLGSDYNDTVTGTDGNDFLTADASDNSDGLNFGNASTFVDNNTLNGKGGNDILYGSQGVDRLNGGDGDDIMNGGAGNDIMSGGAGNDTYYVDSSSDQVLESVAGIDQGGTDIVMSTASFTLGAFVENLTLTGSGSINGTGNDLANTITGNAGDNVLRGMGGNDTLDGGAGANSLYGGAGDDTYIINSAGDHAYESTSGGVDDGGTDLVMSSVTYALGNFIENLTLTGTATINGSGNALDNHITGNAGNNNLAGLGGNDTLDGGAGVNYLYGGAGNDTYIINSINDHALEQTVSGVDDGGTDTVISSISYTLGSFLENLTLTGTGGLVGVGNTLDNTITGNAGNNTLSGLGGNDTLDGQAGADTMNGGAGNDTYIVDNAGDQAVESVAGVDQGGTDLVMSSVSFTLGAFVENLTLTGSGNVNGTGNSLDNVITGNAGTNVLYGLGGNDTLNGGAGTNSLYGGAGNDTYIINSAGDHAFESTSGGVDDGGTDLVMSSVTYALGSFIENLTLTGSATINGAGNGLNNTIIGNAGNNNLAGGAGNDTLNGGGGVNYLYGGAGSDTYIVNTSDDHVTETTVAGVDDGGNDTVMSSISYVLGNFVENLTLTGTANNFGFGNSLDNVIVGNSGNNNLNGKGGHDILTGGLGADTFTEQAGHTYITDFSTAQNDRIDVSSITHGTANPSFVFQDGADVTINLGGQNIVTIQNVTLTTDLMNHIIW